MSTTTRRCWVLRPRHLVPDAELDGFDEHFPNEAVALHEHLQRVIEDLVDGTVATAEDILSYLDWYAAEVLTPCLVARCDGCATSVEDEDWHYDTWQHVVDIADEADWHVLYRDKVLWCPECWEAHPWRAELAAAEMTQRQARVSVDQRHLPLFWTDPSDGPAA